MYGTQYDATKGSLLDCPQTPCTLPVLSSDSESEDDDETEIPAQSTTSAPPTETPWGKLMKKTAAATSAGPARSSSPVSTRAPVRKPPLPTSNSAKATKRPKTDIFDVDNDADLTEDEAMQCARSKRASGPRATKLDEGGRRKIYQAAQDRGEIKSFGPRSFQCWCPKKLKGSQLSEVKLSTDYALQKLEEHFTRETHKRYFETDKHGRAVVDPESRKVVRRVCLHPYHLPLAIVPSS
jgi:hypothetical protein